MIRKNISVTNLQYKCSACKRRTYLSFLINDQSACLLHVYWKHELMAFDWLFQGLFPDVVSDSDDVTQSPHPAEDDRRSLHDRGTYQWLRKGNQQYYSLFHN